MKKLLYIIFLILIGFLQNANAQAELNLASNLQCGTYTYCVAITMKATNGSFQLGTSSILLNYNTDALTFQSYTAVEFDSSSNCTGAWSAQQVDVDAETGEFSLTMKLLNSSSSCIAIDTVTKIVGTVCFTIEQQGGNPDISFNMLHTNLNSYNPDNGTNSIAISNFDSIMIVGELACDCSGPGNSCDDNNVFTTNDIYDINCDCIGEILDIDSDGVADGVDPCQDVQYEAEDAYYVGGYVAANHIQFFGAGFVDWNGWQGDTLEFTVTAIDTGIHDIAIRYSNGSSYDRHLQVEIDGIITNSNLLFPTTDTTWEKWDTVLLSQYFSLGIHTILFTSNPNNEPNIDRITLSYCTGCATAGQWCNDGDSCTILDITDVNCNCAGVLMDSDNDGVCDQADICPNGDDNIDTDGDGTPDDCDNCNDNLVGTTCDDGNPCTINDVFDVNCNCGGTPNGVDTDNDGVCDAFDICVGGDDNLDMDLDGLPDFCDFCDNRLVGQPCDDGNPCTVLDIYNATCGCGGIPIYVDISAVVADVSCYGFGNGTINLSVAGAFGELRYEWNGNDSTSILQNLTPGNYNVTVTDFRNCKDSVDYIITQPDTVLVPYSIIASADSNGSIDLSPTGGILPYTFVWETGDSTEDISNLIPYTYNLTITDANNCIQAIAVDIYPDDMCVDTILQAENGILNNIGIDIWNERYALGDGMIYMTDDTTETATYSIDIPADGFYTIGFRYTDKWATRSVKILIDGAVEFAQFDFPRTYEWENWQRAEFVDYLTAGTHQLVLAHGNHNWGPWIDFISVCNQVVVPISLDANIIDNICYADSVGEITVLSTGGTRNYDYVWSTGDTVETITNLLAGDYYITATDEVGQITIDTFTVLQPTEITPIFTMIDVKCKGQTNGRATVAVTGGTTNYSYQWSNGPTWKSTYNVVAGDYTLTVTDANGCIDISIATVIEPDTMEATFNNTVSIGNDGTVDLTAFGGNPPYTFYWKDSTLTEDRANLPVGNYRITITDTLGCQLKTSTDIYPAGLCLDTIMQAEEGIYQNMSYNIWYQDSATGRGYIRFSNDTLGEANYTFDVAEDGYYGIGFRYSNQYNTDRNVKIEIDNIVEYTDFPFAPTTNWKIYKFVDFNKYLTAGTHTLTLKYRQDWSPRIDFITVCDLGLEGFVTQTDITCHGDSTGAISVTMDGGREPYQYLWSTGDTTETIQNLAVGMYWIQVTDTLNQIFTDTIDIIQSLPILPIITKTNIDCNGNANGNANVNVTGGNGNYTYLWSNNATTNSLTNLNIGNYDLTVTDNVGCTGSAITTITEPSILTANISAITNVDCNGNNTGSATLTTTGGTTFYAYNWANGQTNPTATNLLAGTYTPTITDANGCIDTILVTITEPTVLVSSIINSQNINCNGNSTGSISTSTIGGTGTYTFLWSNGQTTANLQNIAAGTYTLSATDLSGCVSTITETITESTALGIQLTPTDIDCNGNVNGSISAVTSGGTATYTYVWSSGQTVSMIDNLQSGNYTVSITDSLGCTTSDTTTINEPSVLSFIASVFPTTGANGIVDLTVSGGTSAYTFIWSDGSILENRNDLLVGNYHVTITDANGCSEMERFTIFDDNTCIDNIYQAEAATLSGANIVLDDATGALGDGYTDFGADTLELVMFNVSTTMDTTYEISIRYTQGTEDKLLAVSIDGNLTYPTLIFSKTTDWNTWSYVTFMQNLPIGSHSIELKNIESEGPDIDYLSLCMTADTTTSTIEINNESVPISLQTYPNPVKNILNIDIELSTIQEGNLTIFDVNGQVKYQQKIRNNGSETIQKYIDVTRFAAGIYFVQLKTAKGNIIKKVTVL